MAQTTIFQPSTVEAGTRHQFGPCENYGGELDLGQVSLPNSIFPVSVLPFSLPIPSYITSTV